MDRAEWDQSAARTAKELRDQLAQMTAAAQVLEGTAADEKSKQYLAMLDQSICRMLRIVGRLELTGRLGGDEPPELNWRYSNLALLTEELGHRLGQLLAYIGVELTVKVPDVLVSRADEGLVRQMLMELVSNAAKKGKHVKLTLARHGDRAVFTVEDDGPGVSPEEMNDLFRGAEQAVPDLRRGGVGVAIARRVAELHGGTLVADCAPGRGLRAAVSIPLDTEGTVELKDPGLGWDQGGFDEELVSLSYQLPAEAIQMELK